MKAAHRLLLALALSALGACAHVSRQETLQSVELADRARSSAITCAADCRIASPLLDLGDAAFAATSPGHPRHSVVILDAGQDSLLARVHLIRAARHSVDLQTFHFERDDSGRVVLDELRAAARRGVRVRLLMDQLSGLADPELQAQLAAFHRNFEVRVYNPIFDQARINPFEFFGGIIFRFRDLNRRMHNKLMIVDDRVAIIGGRNIQDEYFDWHGQYNYRDRDVLVAGPATTAMKANFDAFWSDPRALQPARLADVARVLLQNHGPPPAVVAARSPRVEALADAAADGGLVFEQLKPYRYDVGQVSFYADLPSKHANQGQSHAGASGALLAVLGGATREILLQTPYLVLSRPARNLFRRLHKRPSPVAVIVSTNSLAATDAFPAYAMSYKYKRMFLRELGFQIYEFKPFPKDRPTDIDAAAGAAETLEAKRYRFSGYRQGPVPLKTAGVRTGLHSKSMVVDEDIAIVGSHNFDPRSNDYNTESLVMVHDPVFAQALAASIRRDTEPGNSWVIAPKAKLPVLSQLNYNLGKLSEKLPIFDIWPFPYATSYELKPDCQPLPPADPGFLACYEPVGDFPEVNLTMKMVYTRVLTVFGAGFIPIL